MSHSRSGSIFVFAFGLLLVMITLTYAFMSISRIGRDAARPLNLRSLAEMAAQQGASHALDAITRDYIAQPNVPTTINLSQRSGFAPIDTLRVNRHQANSQNFSPWGNPASAEDQNENDTKTESLLHSHYVSTYHGDGTYRLRYQPYSAGRMLSHGQGRYIEPGYWHSDLAGKPVSFHLQHPIPANAASTDPAIRRGENYLPDINSPLYLDRDLAPVADRASSRFRLRYAVAVEDLSGHLPLSFQGPHTDGIAGADTLPVGVPVADADAAKCVEIDQSIAGTYGDSMFNLASGSRSWMGWMIANGMGLNQGLFSERILAGFAGATPQYWTMSSVFPSVHPDTKTPITTGGGSVFASNRGPLASVGQMSGWLQNQNGVDTIAGAQEKSAPSLCYTFTPYGRRPVKVAGTPSHYRDGYTDCPWQINLPTAAPEAVARMVQAYLPKEFRTIAFTKKTIEEFDGFDAFNGAEKWKNSTTITLSPAQPASVIMIDLFASPSFAPLFAHLGHPYPGTDPQDAPTASNPWISSLGQSINLNTAHFNVIGVNTATGRIPRELKYIRPVPPFYGMDHKNYSYILPMADSRVVKSEAWAGGERWTLTPGNSSTQQALTLEEGYWYEHSYWMDATIALLHAISTAQLAWIADDGRSWDGDPLAGRPQYPAVSPYPMTWKAKKADWLPADMAPFSNPYLAPLLADGKPSAARDLDMMDFDADGDGICETPSGFDTIEEVDRQFVRNLGEHWGDVTGVATLKVPAQGLYLIKDQPVPGSGDYWGDTNYLKHIARLVPWTVDFNILKLRDDKLIPDDGANGAKQASLMELLVNDMRMSFFGASPNYPGFRGIDFDNDGTVRCSAYSGGSAPISSGRFARAITPALGDVRFSLTGCFTMQKSHFYRVFVRGEVVDTTRMLPVASSALEVVYAVDPAGRLYDVGNRAIPVDGMPMSGPFRIDPDGNGDSSDADISPPQTLYRRWHQVLYQGYGPLVAP